MQCQAVRSEFTQRLADEQPRLVETAQRLIRTPSENPPGDTAAIAAVAGELLSGVDGAEVALVPSTDPIVNVVARIKGGGPGRRLIFNGHLDTFPAGESALWSDDPFAGKAADGRIGGRGASDMKGGLACSILAFAMLAEIRDAWAGELVVTLAGDEETMGVLGTQYLLDTVPHATGDAMICADAGSPMVVRFGEKGLIWLEVTAEGRAAHGAHVHLGENAVERLMGALGALVTLCDLPVATPPEVADAIAQAADVSQTISGAGETRVLQALTVNIGTFDGGISPNLVPDRARAGVDIRLPIGVTVAEVEAAIARLLDPLAGVAYRIERRYEPNWTDPDHEIVRLAVKNGQEILGTAPVVNMRVGASDSRLYRRAGIPSIVYGLTPHNLGGGDEYATLDDLFAVFHVMAMTAFDFLSPPGDGD
ncbi:MAG: M20/M25/M40 family metallo-hydrolase [Rhodospirillales bacterium]|jgi:acetylornithine deacetylase/succinyl-diaminopimelate desuccinylase-like protein|nr:M20/M25/M40 family metallo-hydrolase [Rhodospirillales bacterium]MDP6883464.1 M20/M25/M40 family metallo-hydrolase [Rhodospirillales bacterium]